MQHLNPNSSLDFPKTARDRNIPSQPREDIRAYTALPSRENSRRRGTIDNIIKERKPQLTVITITSDGSYSEEKTRSSSRFLSKYNPLDAPISSSTLISNHPEHIVNVEPHISRATTPRPITVKNVVEDLPPISSPRTASKNTTYEPITAKRTTLTPETPKRNIQSQERKEVRDELIDILEGSVTTPWLNGDSVIQRLILALKNKPYTTPKLETWIPYFNNEAYITSDCISTVENNNVKIIVGLAGLINETPIIYPFGNNKVDTKYPPQDIVLTYSNDNNTYEGTVKCKLMVNNDDIFVIKIGEITNKQGVILFTDMELPVIFKGIILG